MASAATLEAPIINTDATPKVGETWRFTPGNGFTSARGNRIDATVAIVAIDLASERRAFGNGVDGFDIRFEDGVIFKATAAELAPIEPPIEPPIIDAEDDDDDEDDEDAACRTPDCDESTDDGEGWNGYCGNCADRIEGDRDSIEGDDD